MKRKMQHGEFPCSHCSFVSKTKAGLAGHVYLRHKLLAGEKEELELFRSAVLCADCGGPIYPNESVIECIKNALKDWVHIECPSQEEIRKEIGGKDG